MKKKPESNLRWAVLFLTCVVMVGNYYCYDIPASLHTQLKNYLSNAQHASADSFELLFSLLYSVYSVPNIVLPFFGGYFIDRFGVRVCLLWFVFLTLLGQFFFTGGLILKSWGVMFLGRILYGLGGESLGVANSSLLSEWFKGKEMAFAFGLNLSIARLGSVFNNLLSPHLAAKFGIKYSFYFGIVLCALSMLSACFVVYVDDELYSMEKRPYLLEHLSEPLLLSKGDHEGDIHATDRGRDSALNSSDDERKEGDNETRPLVNDTDEESGKVKLKLKRVTPKKSPELRTTPSSEECGFFFDDCRDRGDKGNASTNDVITEYVDHKIAIKMASKISSNVHKTSKKLWKYEDGVESKSDKKEGGKNDEENDKKEKDGILIEEEEVEDQDAIDKREEEEDFVINEILKKMTPDTTSDDENFTYDNHSQKIVIKSSGTEPLNESKKKSIFWSSSLKTNGHHKRNGDDSSIGFRCVSNFSSLFWAITFSSMFVYGCIMPFNNVASALLMERNFFIPLPESSPCTLLYPSSCQNKTNIPINCPENRPNHVYQLPLPTSCTVGSRTYAPLRISDIHCDQEQWSEGCAEEHCVALFKAEQQAATAMSMPYIVAAGLSPLLGKLVDQYGYRATVAAMAPVCLLVVHAVLAVTDISPLGVLVMQGGAYAAFAAVIWPSIPLIVEEKYIGLAYGLITSVNNFGLALFPIIVASIFNHSKSRYIPNCEYFFISVSSAAFFIGIYLNYLDSKNGNVLNSPSAPTAPIQEGILHSPSKSELYADIENDGRNFDSEEYLITDRNAFKNSAI